MKAVRQPSVLAGRTSRISALIAFSNAVASRFTIIGLTFLGARYLGAEQFGVFAFVMSAASSIATLSSVGVGIVSNSTASQYYEDDPDTVSIIYSGILAICIVLSLFFALAFLVPVSSTYSDLSSMAFFATLFLASSLMTIGSATEGLSYGVRRTGTMLVVSLVVLAISPAASAWLMNFYGLLGAIAALLLFRSLQSGLLLTAILLRTKIRIVPFLAWENRRRLKRILIETSLPLAGAAVLAAPITTLGLYILQQQSGAVEVGAFAIAYQYFLMLSFIPTAMGHFLLSRLSAKGTHQIVILKYALRYLAVYGVLGFCAMLGLTYTIPLISQTVPAKFPSMALLGVAVLLYSMSIGFNNYWAAVNKARIVLFAQIAWSAPILLFTLIASKNHGGAALAFGFMIGSALQLSVHLIFIKLTQKDRQDLCEIRE